MVSVIYKVSSNVSSVHITDGTISEPKCLFYLLSQKYANVFAEFAILYFLSNAFVFKFSDIKVVRVQH